jgi:hypothetical protein
VLSFLEVTYSSLSPKSPVKRMLSTVYWRLH